MYQLQEALFDKLDSFNIPYSKDQKLLNNMAKLHSESIRVQADELRNNDTTTWIGKHAPISVSQLSSLIEQPIYFALPNLELRLSHLLLLLVV